MLQRLKWDKIKEGRNKEETKVNDSQDKVRLLQEEKEQMYDLTHSALIFMRPCPTYPLSLQEQTIPIYINNNKGVETV